ncbi:MAG: hypothetical protein JWN70_1246 [Planctomycetaceae bacterium]|nr:hypothetical protein [Planctomycetaceae bacterium]
MERSHINLVRFIGGPFDGFHQHVSDAVDDLPSRIAIPVNQRSAQVLGLASAPSQARRTVIYHLQLLAGVATYSFHPACLVSDVVSEVEPTIGSEVSCDQISPRANSS